MTFLKKNLSRVLMMTAVLTASSQIFGALPDVLDRIPDNADAVIVLKDLKTVSTKIANTATRLNLPVPPDPVGMVAQRMGITRGLDQNGSVAVYVSMPANKEDTEGGPPIVMLIPTTDSKAMLEGLNPSAPENGISTVTLPNDAADTGYVATVGNYVALAQSKELLTQFLANKTSISGKLTAPVKAAFENNDLVVFANVPHFRDRLLDSIKSFKPMIGMLVAMQGQGDPAANAMGAEILTSIITGFEQIITDADGGVETIRLDDAGVTLGFGAHLKPGTPSGNFIAAQKPLPNTELTGLPNGKFIMAASGTWDAGTMGKLVGFFGDMLTKNPAIANSPKLDAVKRNFEAQKQVVSMMTAARFALYEQELTNAGIFSGVVDIDVTDSAKFKEIVRKSVEDNAAASEALQPSIAINLVKKEESFVSHGVTVDEYQMKYTAKDPLPTGVTPEQSKMEIATINKMWGQDGMRLYMGYFDKSAVEVINGDQKLMDSAIYAAKAKSNELGALPEISAVNKQVVPNAIGVIYLSVDRIIAQVKKVAATQEGAPAGGVALGGNTYPVVISAGVTESVLTTEMHFPTSAIGTMIQAAQGQ